MSESDKVELQGDMQLSMVSVMILRDSQAKDVSGDLYYDFGGLTDMARNYLEQLYLLETLRVREEMRGFAVRSGS